MVRMIQLSDGKKIPAVAWGNGTGGLIDSGQKAVDVGKVVLDAGILHIDTAQSYGTEAETAASIKAARLDRSNVWITTKLSDTTLSAEEMSAADVKKSVQASLDRLETKPDLLLIHNPYVPGKGKIGQFWTVLEDLVYDGTLRGVSLGVSNFRPQDLDQVLDVARIKPVVNQLEYHPYVLSHLEPILRIHREHGIVTESYGPLTPILRHPTGGPLKPVLARMAQRLGTDEAAVLILWTIGTGAVTVTSSNNPANIKKIAGIENLRDLTSDEVDEITEVGKRVHYRHYREHLFEDFPPPALPSDL